MKRIAQKESERAYHQDRRSPDLPLSVGLDIAPRGGGLERIVRYGSAISRRTAMNNAG